MTRDDYLFYVELRAKLRAALLAISANPSNAVTVSTGDGQKSVTYKRIAEVKAALDEVEEKCAAYERAYNGGSCGFNRVPIIWS